MSRAIAFTLLAAISLISLAAWDSWQAHANKFENTANNTSNMARALAQHAEATILSTDNILAGLVENIEGRGLRNLSQSSLHSFLMRRVAEQEIVYSLFIIDEKGRPIVNSQPKLTAGVNYADRIYFAYHRDFSDRGPFIGPAVQSKTTGAWIITVSRRLQHPDGTFAGLVLATISLDFFRFFYEEFEIGNSGAIFLASDEGTLLVRRPFIESAIGSSIAQGPVFNEYRTKGAVGTAMLTSLLDRTERLYSYRRLENYPLLVAVALSKEDIFANWRSETYRLVTACLLLVILIGASGIYLVYQINLRESTEEQLRVAKRELETLAAEDSLTGLANRRTFDEAFATEFNRAMRNRSALALVMIDVDRFKQFNDLYGHPAGDDCLIRISRAIKSVSVRPADLTARYGGEEMIVLLPETDTEGARSIAERLRAAVQDLNIPHSASSGGMVTISLGVASVKPTLYLGTAVDLLKLADEALYKAKAQGRNQVCLAET